MGRWWMLVVVVCCGVFVGATGKADEEWSASMSMSVSPSPSPSKPPTWRNGEAWRHVTSPSTGNTPVFILEGMSFAAMIDLIRTGALVQERSQISELTSRLDKKLGPTSQREIHPTFSEVMHALENFLLDPDRLEHLKSEAQWTAPRCNNNPRNAPSFSECLLEEYDSKQADRTSVSGASSDDVSSDAANSEDGSSEQPIVSAVECELYFSTLLKETCMDWSQVEYWSLSELNHAIFRMQTLEDANPSAWKELMISETTYFLGKIVKRMQDEWPRVITSNRQGSMYGFQAERDDDLVWGYIRYAPIWQLTVHNWQIHMNIWRSAFPRWNQVMSGARWDDWLLCSQFPKALKHLEASMLKDIEGTSVMDKETKEANPKWKAVQEQTHGLCVLRALYQQVFVDDEGEAAGNSVKQTLSEWVDAARIVQGGAPRDAFAPDAGMTALAWRLETQLQDITRLPMPVLKHALAEDFIAPFPDQDVVSPKGMFDGFLSKIVCIAAAGAFVPPSTTT